MEGNYGNTPVQGPGIYSLLDATPHIDPTYEDPKCNRFFSISGIHTSLAVRGHIEVCLPEIS